MHRRKGFWIATALVAASLAACSPVAQHLSSSASPSGSLPVSPTPTATSPPSTSTRSNPMAAAFWDDTNGLLVLTPGCASGDNICPDGVIERTGDAGRTWRIFDQVSASLSAIAVAGNDVAWVSESGARCGTGGACMASLVSDMDGFLLITRQEIQTGCTPPSCGPQLLSTTDGGRTWTIMSSWLR
jgi:hypothetical protein